MTKIICLDLDNTLFEADVITDTLKEFNLDIKQSSWDLVEVPEYCRKIIEQRFKESKYMCNLNPCENAINKVEQWINNGFEIICLTARSLDIERETKRMVQKYFPGIKETIVVNGSKIKMLSEIKPVLFVDDGPKYVLESLKLGYNTIMISNKFTLYNHELRNKVNWKTKLANIKFP